MKKLTWFTLVLGALSLTSCNTFVGVSRDFQQFGKGLENKSYGKTWDGQTPPPPANNTAR